MTKEITSVPRKEAHSAELVKILLLLCRREAPPSLDCASIKEIIVLAQTHGLFALLGPQLVELCTRVDEALGRACRERLLYNAHRNNAVAAELLRSLDCLRKAGIDALSFKGGVLGQLVYGSCAVRQAGDIDIFVRKGEVRTAIQALANIGYSIADAWSDALTDGHLCFDCECELLNRERRMCIDLHWEFTARNVSLPMPVERLYSRLTTIDFQGASVLTFCPEDTLLILSLHGGKHHWERLEWILTISELIRRNPSLDWTMIETEASDMGLTHLLESGLWMASELFGAPLPDGVLQRVRQNTLAQDLSRRCLRWHSMGPSFEPSPFVIRCFHAASRSSVRGKLAYWFGVIATPSEKDYERRVPKKLTALYYPLRALRLCADFGGQIYSLARRRFARLAR